MTNWYNPVSGAMNPSVLDLAHSVIGQNAGATFAGNQLGGSSPSGGGGPSYSSPDLTALTNQIQAQGVSDKASMNNALQRYIISYGQVPDFSKLGIGSDAQGYLSGAITDQVKQLAAQNEAGGTSVHARLAAQDAIAQRQVGQQMAARGMLHSGETGYGLQQEAQNAKNQSFDTLNDLLGNISNTVGQFQQAERDRAMQLAEMEMQAAMGSAGGYTDPGSGDGGGVAPPTNPVNTKKPKAPTFFTTAPGAGHSPVVLNKKGIPRGI